MTSSNWEPEESFMEGPLYQWWAGDMRLSRALSPCVGLTGEGREQLWNLERQNFWDRATWLPLWPLVVEWASPWWPFGRKNRYPSSTGSWPPLSCGALHWPNLAEAGGQRVPAMCTQASPEHGREEGGDGCRGQMEGSQPNEAREDTWVWGGRWRQWLWVGCTDPSEVKARHHLSSTGWDSSELTPHPILCSEPGASRKIQRRSCPSPTQNCSVASLYSKTPNP